MLCDLNVQAKATGAQDRQILLCRAHALGWDLLAWNIQVNASQLGQKHSIMAINPPELVNLDKIKTREANSQRALVVPPHEEESIGAEGNLQKKVSQPKQLTRLTVVLDDPLDLHALHNNSGVLHAFDFITLQPTTAKAFQAVCSHGEV